MVAVLYSADVVCTMAGPPLAHGGVLVGDGRVLAVGEAARLRPDADRSYHVDGVILPGLVNAHTHLEYSDADTLARPGPFHVWIRALAGMAGGWDDERWGRSAHRGALRMLRSGVTAAGDVVTRGPGVPAACGAGLVGDSWVEVVMVDRMHQDAVVAAVKRALTLPAPGRRVGIAPHAGYTLAAGVLQALAALAARADVPLHLHCAESRAEVVALAEGSGPLADAARARGMDFEWLDGGTGLSPVRYLDQLGVLTPRTTLAHGVWVDADEAALLAERAVTVVCCPRPNELLQVGQAPLEHYAEAGTALALGTDSAASSPDLDLLAEAAAWARLARSRGLGAWPSAAGPISPEEAALRLATADGAQHMGWGDRAGRLEPGRRADMVGVAVHANPEVVYREVVERGPGRQVLTIVGGVRKARRARADQDWPPIDDWLPQSASGRADRGGSEGDTNPRSAGGQAGQRGGEAGPDLQAASDWTDCDGWGASPGVQAASGRADRGGWGASPGVQAASDWTDCDRWGATPGVQAVSGRADRGGAA